MWFFFEGRPKPCKGWKDGRKLNLISLSWVPKPSSHCDYFTGQTMLVEPLNISRLGTPFFSVIPRKAVVHLNSVQTTEVVFFLSDSYLVLIVYCSFFFFLSTLSSHNWLCQVDCPPWVSFFPFTTITKVLPIKEFLATLYILWVFPANLDFPPKEFLAFPQRKIFSIVIKIFC